MKSKRFSFRHSSILPTHIALTLGLAVAGLSTQSAQAASVSWNGGTGTWETTSNWSTSALPASSDTAVFGGTAGTVTVGSNESVLGLQFSTTGYTLALGTNALTLGSGGIDVSTLTSGTTNISGATKVSAGLQTWSVGTGATLDLGSIGVVGGDAADLYTPNGAIVIIKKGTGLNGTITTTTADGWGWRSGAVAGTGLLGAGMVIDNGDATCDWASVGNQTAGTSRAIVAPTYTSVPGGTSDAHNVKVTSNASYTGGNASWASILVNGATLSISNTVYSDSGVILEGGGSISGGVLKANANGLYVYTPGAGGTINSAIQDNGTKNLYKALSGSLTLTGNDTYTGVTNVWGGTLNVSGSGAINSTSGITVNGSGAKYVHTSSTASTRTITLTQGAVDGTGTLGTVNVANLAGNAITNGNGGSSTLTIGTLACSGAGTINVNEANATKGLALTTFTTANTGLGEITINATNNSSWSSIGGNGSGVYDLITFTTLTGGLSDFTKGTVSGLSGRQSATLGKSSTAITLTIAGDNPAWTGNGSQTWTTATFGDNTGPNAWALNTVHTATNFWASDSVAFNDTYNLGSGDVAVTNSTVTITGGVAPASTAFNNTAVNYTVNSSDSTGITAGNLSKSGTGTVTINTDNSYTGATTINAGTLQIGNGTTGSISSSSAVTVAPGATLGVNLAAAGTFGSAITDNGTIKANSSNANTLSGVISGTGAINATGSGVLTLSNASNSYSGALTISNGGTVSVAAIGALGGTGSSVTLGSTSTNGTLEYIGGTGSVTTTKVFTLATGGTGTIQVDTSGAELKFNAANTLTGSGQLIKTGAGQLSMGDGGQNWSGGVVIVNGTLQGGNTLTTASFGTGTITVGLQGSSNNAAVGLGNGGVSAANNITVASGAGTRSVQGGSGGNETFSGTVTLGDGGGVGNLYLTTLYAGSSSSQLILSNTVSGTGNISMFGNNIYGAAGSHDVTVSGAQNQSGTISSIDAPGGVANPTHGVNTISGALGSGITSVTQNSSNSSLVLSGTNTAFTGTVTVTTGTLKMGGASALSAVNQVTVASGSTFDLNGNNETIGGLGTGTGTVTNTGASKTLTLGGSISNSFGGVISASTPANTTLTVALTGGATQTLTGVNTYSGITTVNSGTLQIGDGTTDGSIAASSAITDNSALVFNLAGSQSYANVIGGAGTLAKSGAGALTLTGTNTYSGATTVNGGTLAVGGSGSVNGSSGITINGLGAKFVQASLVASTPAVTLTQGTLDGSGAMGAVTVANGANVLANGNGGAGNGATSSLTLGSLSFGGAATANLQVASGSPSVMVTGALATNPVGGHVTINANGIWAIGLNNLIGYGSFGGAVTDFTLGTITGLTSRQTASALLLNGNNLALNITGDAPKWTGADNGNWVVGTTGANANWKLITAGTATDYVESDAVLFDDSVGAGPTTIDITAANVSPTSTTFNNTTKDYVLTSSGGYGIATGILVKSGTGTATITTNNTYTGATTINAGTLQIGDGSTDGSITNSVGITDNASLVYKLVGDQSYVHNIGGTGSVTEGGIGAILTLGGANSFSGGLNIVDSGTVKAGSSTALGAPANILTFGALSGGTLDVNGQSVTLGGVNGDNSAIIQSSTGATGTLTINSTADSSYAGYIQNGSGGTLALSKSGSATLTLSGSSSYSGATTVNGGTLVVSGNYSGGSAVTVNGGGTLVITGSIGNSAVDVIGGSSGGAVLSIEGGSLTTTVGTNVYDSTVNVGYSSGGVGSLKLGSGSLSVSKQLGLGNGSYGTYLQSGGTASLGGFLALGLSTNGVGMFNQSGGTFSMSTAPVTNGARAGGTGVVSLGGTAVFNLNSTGANGFWVGEAGTGTLNVSGAASLNIASGNTDGLYLAKASGSVGTVNLLGGTATTPKVIKGAGTTGTLNFNGGALKAAGASATFMTGLTNAYVYGGGGVIDNNSSAITIGQALVAPTGDGANGNPTVANGGTGYVDAPLVTVSGAGGTGATAVAIVSGGAVTGIAVTNPGTGYTGALSFTLTGGGGSGASINTLAQTADTSGGLTFQGTGTTTLTGANTYTGATTVNSGTLALGATGSIATSSGVTIAAGSTLDVTAATPFAMSASQTVTFKVDGSGAGSSGLLKAAALDITNAHVAFTVVNPLDDNAYVLASYTSLTGSAFASVTPPTGYTINYTYNSGTQIALVKAAGYDSWATNKGLTGANNGPQQDPNNNGITNLMEYALNGDPLNGESPASILPTEDSSGTNLVFDFHRLHDSASDTTQVFQYGSDLTGWTDVAIPASGTVGIVVVTADSATIDHVTVTVAKGANTKLFGRLHVTKP